MSHPHAVIKLPRYMYDVTCSICCPSMAIFILGEFGALLTTIALVFLVLNGFFYNKITIGETGGNCNIFQINAHYVEHVSY